MSFVRSPEDEADADADADAGAGADADAHADDDFYDDEDYSFAHPSASQDLAGAADFVALELSLRGGGPVALRRLARIAPPETRHFLRELRAHERFTAFSSRGVDFIALRPARVPGLLPPPIDDGADGGGGRAAASFRTLVVERLLSAGGELPLGTLASDVALRSIVVEMAGGNAAAAAAAPGGLAKCFLEALAALAEAERVKGVVRLSFGKFLRRVL
jgi:hypothetical protein